ncbi:MAG: hypothetical protein SOX77_01895 [Candidatus Borkfalkiaceae bacterium]|nr:hypothetical protein [Christensenellaceae bacterium]
MIFGANGVYQKRKAFFRNICEPIRPHHNLNGTLFEVPFFVIIKIGSNYNERSE